MKRYIKSQSAAYPMKIEVIFDIELISSDSEVAAATYKGYEIPEGELPPADKEVIVNSQVWQDYQDFIEVIEDFIEDFNLHIYYKNKEGTYDSFYWAALAKDNKGNDLFDFKVVIRISTHDAHRTAASQKHKKEEKAELRKLAGDKHVQTRPITVVINDKSEKFKSYMDAIVYVDEKLNHALEIMTRRKK